MYLLKLMMLLKKFCHDCYQKLCIRRNSFSNNDFCAFLVQSNRYLYLCVMYRPIVRSRFNRDKSYENILKHGPHGRRLFS